MLKIGDFSRLAMVSVRMLRYYDEQGLLSPAHIDKFTGYRYYHASQLADVAKIKSLQNMGISLAEILTLQQHGFERSMMLSAARSCYSKKLEELNKLNTTISRLEFEIARLERNEDMQNYDIKLKTIPKRSVAAMRRVIPLYEQEGELWKTLYSNLFKNHVKLSDSCYPTAVYMDCEYKETHPDIEVQVGVDGEYSDFGEIHFKTAAETTAASVTFTGHYAQINDIYCQMAAWLEQNEYEFDGNMFLVYITSPSEVSDHSQLVSELCIPVRKRI